MLGIAKYYYDKNIEASLSDDECDFTGDCTYRLTVTF